MLDSEVWDGIQEREFEAGRKGSAWERQRERNSEQTEILSTSSFESVTW